MTKKPNLARKVGQRIRELRLAATNFNDEPWRCTQEALAESCGLNPLHLSCLERGVKLPGLVTLIKLGDALGVGLDELVQMDAKRTVK